MCVFDDSVSDPVIDACTFVGNTSVIDGGGLLVGANSARVRACIFDGNQSGLGAGLHCSIVVDPRIEGCVFSNNTAAGAGAVYLFESEPVTLRNCTIADNSSGFGAAGLYTESSTSPVVHNCIAWGNAPGQIDSGTDLITVEYSDVQGGWTGMGHDNVDVAPLFIDSANGNYHLRDDSPLIDAGEPSPPVDYAGQTDIDGDPREMGTGPDPRADIGADEVRYAEATLNQGVEVTLDPGGGTGLPIDDAVVAIANQNGGAGQTVSVIEVPGNLVPDAGGFAALGSQLVIETSMDDGEFFMTVGIPFEIDDVMGESPLDTDLTYYDTVGDAWILAIAGNTAHSPGHTGPVGDRTQVESTIVPVPSAELGDYGVYWNPITRRGFVWANVDHTTIFSPAANVVARTYCRSKRDSAGCRPRISFSGLPTLTGDDDFFVNAEQVLGDTAGFLLWSLERNATGAGGGSTPRLLGPSPRGVRLCVYQPTYVPVGISAGTPGACDAGYAFHFSQAMMSSAGLAAGTDVFAQYVYRDPAHPDGSSLAHTDALRITISP